MEEIYWITRLDSIRAMFLFLLVVSCSLELFSVIGYFIEVPTSSYEGDKIAIRRYKKIFFTALAVLSVSGIGLVFTPTSKEAYMICGVGTVVDYVKNDSVAVNIPHKAIIAIDNWIDEEINDKPIKTE